MTLYEVRCRVEQAILYRGLNKHQVLGKIALRTGVFITRAKPDAPNLDADTLAKLKVVIREVVGLDL